MFNCLYHYIIIILIITPLTPDQFETSELGWSGLTGSDKFWFYWTRSKLHLRQLADQWQSDLIRFVFFYETLILVEFVHSKQAFHNKSCVLYVSAFCNKLSQMFLHIHPHLTVRWCSTLTCSVHLQQLTCEILHCYHGNGSAWDRKRMTVVVVVVDQDEHVLLKATSCWWTVISVHIEAASTCWQQQLICVECSSDVISVSQFRESAPCLQTENEKDEEFNEAADWR